MNKNRTTVIIGAGPAGLTAALELLRHTDIKPIVIEADDCVGGISRTVNYKGNRIDIGGHRFFSKSDWVMNWWKEILPPESSSDGQVEISYQNKKKTVSLAANPQQNADKVMLIRNRLSRIYYLRRFFDYPLKLSLRTLSNLGLVRVVRIGFSYIWASLFPRKPENSLEDFLINRFGRRLYLTFFKDYTEKVWGVPCQNISAEWGAQRIKGLNITKALVHAVSSLFKGKNKDVSQKGTNTSLIERFLYPKFGPGQMWEAVAEQVIELGGTIHFKHKVTAFTCDNGIIQSVRAECKESGQVLDLPCEHVISTMPVKDLINGLGKAVPPEISAIANELPYRDFITVGLLCSKMLANPQSNSSHANNMPPDNWIYIQENDVKVGRLQIFNNWSPDMVADPEKIWMGLEYFCNEGDPLWNLSDAELMSLAKIEMTRMGLIDPSDVEDSVVIRMPKAYPAYFGAYSRFGEIRAYLDTVANLFPVGRNGMHRYNNQDHSMLSAKLAAEAIASGSTDKTAIWEVNVDDEYHEEKEAKQ